MLRRSSSTCRWALVSSLAMASVGCTSTPGPETATGDEASSGGEEASSTESGEDTSSEGGVLPELPPCETTDDCREGVCVAVWDQAAGELLRPFVCEEACIDVADPMRVCADDAGCCGDATCDGLGVCRAQESEP